MEIFKNNCHRCGVTGIEDYVDHGFSQYGYEAIEPVRCQLCDGTGSLCEDDTLYYRWVVINNQETCYCQIVKVLDGYFKSAEDVKKHYKDDYCFEECLFGVKPIDFSATPKWLAEKTGEFVK